MADAWISIRDFIGQNWLSTTISILAVIYAVYEARRRRGPRLAFQFTGYRIIGTQRDRLPADVQIAYHGININNLALTQLVVWNAGDAPLRSSDIPDHDPICFYFGNQAIYVAELSKVTREVANIEIELQGEENQKLKVAFDFLDKNDGALIDVWHSSDDLMPDTCGTVLGQKEGILSLGRFALQYRGSSPPRASSSFEKFAIMLNRVIGGRIQQIMPIASISLGLLLAARPFAHLLLPFIDAPQSDSSDFSQSPITSVILGLSYAAMGLWLHLSIRRRFPKALTPD